MQTKFSCVTGWKTLGKARGIVFWCNQGSHYDPVVTEDEALFIILG